MWLACENSQDTGSEWVSTQLACTKDCMPPPVPQNKTLARTNPEFSFLYRDQTHNLTLASQEMCLGDDLWLCTELWGSVTQRRTLTVFIVG